jgi:hypothetical protein
MKRIVQNAATAAALLFLAGCGGDNSYNGKDGLIETPQNVSSSLRGIQENVLEVQSAGAVQRTESAASAIEALLQEQSLQALEISQQRFTELMRSWKQIEATYVAGAYESAMIDTPRLIDFFHVGNEEIAPQLDAVIEGTGDVEAMMYKNSLKSINALEYLLFGNEQNNSAVLASMQAPENRRVQAAQVAIAALEGHMGSIDAFYRNDEAFVTGGSDSVEELINVLIDSSYKLKEWRVGEPAGFTLKFENDPDASRLEYHDSRTSLDAVRAILCAHQSVMDSGLKAIAEEGGAEQEAMLVQEALTAALAACDAYAGALFDEVSGLRAEALYAALADLHSAYYVSLISALDLTTDIIEADGD